MSDSIRKLLEKDDALRRLIDPLEEARRQTSAWADACRSLGAGSETLRFLKEHEVQQKLLSSIVDDYHASSVTREALERFAEESERYRKLLAGPIEEARRIGLLDPGSDVHRAMETAAEAHRCYKQMFRLPDLNETLRLAQEATSISRLAAFAFGAPEGIAELQARMSAVQNPWLNIDLLEHSSQAFAELQAIGRIANQFDPFDATLAESLRGSLGDWRDLAEPSLESLTDPLSRSRLYIERGFDPALTDFTVPAFEESVELAGLRDVEEGDEAEHHTEDHEVGFARNRAAFDKLQRFEVAIRRFIQDAMQAAYGNSWAKHQLPVGMYDRWVEKKETARRAGESDRPLIDYADFTDYRAIIERKDNWNAVFKPVFGRAEDVRESFQRLFPVRIATMHARIITLDDELYLLAETKRVLRSIRRKD